MNHGQNNQIEVLKSDLDSVDDQRYENLQLAAWLLAETRFLKAVLIGVSSKSIETILREGKAMIEEEYKDLAGNGFEKLEGILEERLRREVWRGV